MTLSVTPNDAWNNFIRYSVDPDFFFTLGSAGDIRVRTRDQTGSLVDLTNVKIPAVILSHGENGFGATSLAGVARTVPGGWTGDESDNASNATVFYFRTRTEVTTVTGGEFDDVVTWVSLNQLFARMVSAGRLP